ncbi:MAG: 2-phosphosulfolactate phosphatase [Verrucomicrobiales bacterium]|nr:2-phosphosulfolactate phosphatase [Verrucomicrobiales bacterium]
MNLEVLFTPADFGALKQRDLSQSVCVVFDILRATTSMTNALANGAAAIIPVSEIAQALEVKKQQPDVLLAGEREGLRIRAAQTGSIDFDLGNSPREFTADKVRGKTIVMTTTNGTRALNACVGAKQIFIASFLNLRALAQALHGTENLLLVCAGTFEEAAYEDTLGAGALADFLWNDFSVGHISDSSQMAREIYLSAERDFAQAIQFSKNARRLLANPDLHDDVPFCFQRDSLNFVAQMHDGIIRRTGKS